MDSFDVLLTVNGADTVRISLVPERRDGVTAGTVCIVSVDNILTPEPGLMDMTAKSIGQALQECFELQAAQDGYRKAVPVQWFPSQKRASTLEDSCKKTPDVELLKKKMEKKYY